MTSCWNSNNSQGAHPIPGETECSKGPFPGHMNSLPVCKKGSSRSVTSLARKGLSVRSDSIYSIYTESCTHKGRLDDDGDFCIALVSTLEQTHCTFVMGFQVSDCIFLEHGLKRHQSGVCTVLLLHGWGHMKLLPS